MARFTNGWVKIHRKMADPEWSQLLDINSKGLLMELLLMANYKPGRFRIDNKVITLEPGQIVTSIQELMTRLQTSKFIIKTRLDLLTQLGTITQKTGQRGRIITICKYKEYQDDTSNHLPTVLPTLLPTESPTVLPTLLPHNEEVKELKEIKEGEETRGRARSTPQEQIDKFLDVYFAEIEKHYGKRLLKTSILSDLARRIIAEVGLDRSIALAVAFCASNRDYYIRRAHSLDVMLADLSQLDAFA